MGTRVRALQGGDIEQLVALSLRAWAPVFESIAQVLGPGLDHLLHPDWRVSQADAVRQVCASDDTKVWVAESDGQVVGFIALNTFDTDRKIGEIAMLAVDPDHQRRGIGRALTDHGLSELRAAGMMVAMVETGGDPGHEPARLTYQSAGFTNLPIARYFKAL